MGRGKGNTAAARAGSVLRLIGVGDGLARLGFGLRRARRGFRLKAPERLYIAPQEIAPSDPATATDIYSGHFVLAGRIVLTKGASPFLIEPPSQAWANELHGFEWLRHFRDAEHAVVKQHARALVAEWLQQRNGPQKAAWRRPSVTARRVLSWLVSSPLLLADADHGFYRDFLKALARDALRLEALAMRDGVGPGRLLCAIAHAQYALCALNSDRDWKRASQLLGEALTRAILPDGAPLSRNPKDAIEALSVLLPLRNAYTARGRTPPPEFQPAIDRLMQFLRLMRHPGGEIAQFNGMGATQLEHLGALFSFDDGAGAPPHSAPYGGYQRLETGNAVLVVDTGSPPPAAYSYGATAGALSFELSAGPDRLVVNCGAAPAGLTDMREALRETEAHSTLSLDGASALVFAPRGDPEGADRRRLSLRAAAPDCSRTRTDGAEVLRLSQSVWLRSRGLMHRRELTLSADGSSLLGVDSLVMATRRRKAAGAATIRFHLHPLVRIAMMEDSGAIRLQLPGGAVWIFEAEGVTPEIGGSIFFGGLEMQRSTQQIILHVPAFASELRWSFSRFAEAAPR